MKLKPKIIISLLTAILLHSFAMLHPIASNANENEVKHDHCPSWETQYNELMSTTNYRHFHLCFFLSATSITHIVS